MRVRYVWIPVIIALIAVPAGFYYVDWSKGGSIVVGEEHGSAAGVEFNRRSVAVCFRRDGSGRRRGQYIYRFVVRKARAPSRA